MASFKIKYLDPVTGKWVYSQHTFTSTRELNALQRAQYLATALAGSSQYVIWVHRSTPTGGQFWEVTPHGSRI